MSKLNSFLSKILNNLSLICLGFGVAAIAYVYGGAILLISLLILQGTDDRSIISAAFRSSISTATFLLPMFYVFLFTKRLSLKRRLFLIFKSSTYIYVFMSLIPVGIYALGVMVPENSEYAFFIGLGTILTMLITYAAIPIIATFILPKRMLKNEK